MRRGWSVSEGQNVVILGYRPSCMAFEAWQVEARNSTAVHAARHSGSVRRSHCLTPFPCITRPQTIDCIRRHHAVDTPPANTTPLPLRASTKKHVFPGLPHSFTKYPDLPSSRRFNELIVESVRWCLELNPQADKPGRWEMEMPDGYRGIGAGPEKQQREEQDKPCSDGGMRRWIPELRGNRWGALI